MTPYKTPWMNDELTMLQETASRFFRDEMAPNELRWCEEGQIDRDFWNKAAEAGLVCASIPEEYGGAGGNFMHEAVIMTEQFRACGTSSWANQVHSPICAHYILAFGTEDQKRRWLPGMATGELVCGIAMTEPGAGSDLKNIRTTARLVGDEYVVNGSKTFISNGQHADLMIIVAKTDPSAGHKGVSLVVAETRNLAGYVKGRKLKKIGLKGHDTSEPSFSEMRIPRENLLGGVEGRGFYQLMQQLPQERLSIGVCGAAVIEKALADTVRYTSDRQVFGGRLIDLQNTRFKLAEAKTVASVARVFIDNCVERHVSGGGLDPATASMAKWWVSQMQCEIVDEMLQLHGGFGYMEEFAIGRMFTDSRVQKIYGGANEIMKELIARTLADGLID